MADGDARSYAVLIADDDDEVREALASLIDDHPGLRTVAAVENGLLAAEYCASMHPELAVVDVKMDFGGDIAVRAIQAASPETTVVAFTAHADQRTRRRLIESGAARVFVKGREPHLAEDLYCLLRSPHKIGR